MVTRPSNPKRRPWGVRAVRKPEKCDVAKMKYPERRLPTRNIATAGRRRIDIIKSR
jgi:hypothetical protein